MYANSRRRALFGIRLRFLASVSVLAAMLLVVGGGSLWSLSVIEAESTLIDRIYLPRVVAAQRVIEDADAIANYSAQIRVLTTTAERATLTERIQARRETVDRSLGLLRDTGEDPQVLESLDAAIDDMMRSVDAVSALAAKRSDAAGRVERLTAALRRNALTDAATAPPDGTATLLALAATAPSRLVLDRLAAALGAGLAAEGAGTALIAARREELDLDDRLRNLDRFQWEKAARLVALASGYAAEARTHHDTQNARISRLIDHLVVGLGLAFVATVLGVAVLSRWFSRSVIEPIVDLAAATRRIASGDLDGSIPYPPATTEVSALAEALVLFRDATREVRDQRDALAWRTVALDAAADAFVITDPNGVIEYVNPAFTALTGYTAQEAVGRTPAILRSGQQDTNFYAGLWNTIHSGRVWRGELVNRRRDGSLYTQATTIAPVIGADGRPVRFVAVERDVTDSRRFQQELQRLAVTDPLTGLYNRRHLLDVGTAEVGRAVRFGVPLSILVLDLDHFKRINDLHGHATGDRALRAVADTCRAMVRGIDILARLGGEEFVAVLPQTDGAGATELAERLRHGIEAIAVSTEQGSPIHVTASIGVAELSPARTTFDAVLEAGDRALYRAKRDGRNRVRRDEDARPAAEAESTA